MSVSPQTLEWREEGKDAAGKTVYGAAGEITIFGREREGAAAARAAAAPPPAASAVSAPVARGAEGNRDFSSSGREGVVAASGRGLDDVVSIELRVLSPPR